jgi:putative copper export protein
MHVPEATWRFLHLVAAAYWLGGLLVLAVVAVLAVRSLDQPGSDGKHRLPKQNPIAEGG